MNLMYSQASLGWLEPVVIISGWPPLTPGGVTPGVPCGVCMIATSPAGTLLLLGSVAPASWNVQFRFTATCSAAKAFSTSSSAEVVEDGLARPLASSILMMSRAFTPPPALEAGLHAPSRDVPP